MTSIDISVQSPLDASVVVASDITDKVTAPSNFDAPNDFEMSELQMKSSVKGKKRPNDGAADDAGVQSNRAKKSRGRPAKSSTHGRRTRARVLSEGNVCTVSAGVMSAEKSVGKDEGTQTEIFMQPAEMSEMLSHDVALSDTVMTCIKALLTPISSHVHSLQKEMKNIKAAVEQQLSSSIITLAHSDIHESQHSSVDTDSSSSVSDDDGHDGFVPSFAATRKRQKKTERHARRRQSRDVMTKPAQSQPSVEMSRDVVASMYVVDIELKQRRAKNIVMSGVPNINYDFTYVTNLLGIYPPC